MFLKSQNGSVTQAKCPFPSRGFVWRAECSYAELPTVPVSHHGFAMSSAQTDWFPYSNLQSDLIIDWGKSRSCCFLMGNCPNSVYFIKKIAGISLIAKKKAAWPWLCCAGATLAAFPSVTEELHPQEQMENVLLHPLTTGTTTESWWDPELALTEL